MATAVSILPISKQILVKALIGHINHRLAALGPKAIWEVRKVPVLAETYFRTVEKSIDESVKILPKKKTDFTITLGQELLLWKDLLDGIKAGKSDKDIERSIDELTAILDAEKAMLKNRPAEIGLAA